MSVKLSTTYIRIVSSLSVCVFQVGTATTDFVRDRVDSNHLPASDKSKQFITSTVADDSMVWPDDLLHR